MVEKICPLAAQGDARSHYPCLPTCAWYLAAQDCCALTALGKKATSETKSTSARTKG